jgi:hypothetical protein
MHAFSLGQKHMHAGGVANKELFVQTLESTSQSLLRGLESVAVLAEEESNDDSEDRSETEVVFDGSLMSEFDDNSVTLAQNLTTEGVLQKRNKNGVCISLCCLAEVAFCINENRERRCSVVLVAPMGQSGVRQCLSPQQRRFWTAEA